VDEEKISTKISAPLLTDSGKNCSCEVEPMRKSDHVLVFPVKDKYLLIHGLSGTVKLVSKRTAQKFFNGEQTEELKPFFTHLTPEEEYKKSESLCTFLMNSITTCVDGNIAVTCDCNLRCYYCCEIWAKNPHIMGEVMNKYKVNKAFEALETLNKDCKEMKPLTLTGGEPLMKKNMDIVTYILKKGDELGYQFAVLTNGVDLNYFLSELSSVKVMYVQITLDGPRDIHDRRRIFRKGEKTFDTITNNIEKARKMGIPLRIRTNTDSEIFSRISELTEFFTEKGWIDDPCIQFSLNHLYDKNADIDKTQEFISLYEKVLEQAQAGAKIPGIHNFLRCFRRLHPVCEGKSIFWPTFWYCSAVSRKLVFDPFGDVYPCQSMLGWKEERIGVYIPELSFNDNYDKWRNRTIFKMEKCRSCSLALICGGECPYNSLLREKDLYKPVCMVTEKIMTDYLNTFMVTD
jgi:uncharacterized protein